MKQLLSLLALTATLSAVNPASNMKLAFSDEFDGPALDAAKWATHGESTAMSFVTAGKLKALRITLIKRDDMIQTNGIRAKHEQVRGYFEASIRMNLNKGHTGNMSIRPKDDKVLPSILALWESTGADRLDAWARYVDDQGQRDLRSDASGTKSLGEFLVKSAALPASLITPVEVPFRGRVLKLAGERTFDTWTITVINDTNFKIRTAFEQWMNGISKLSDGTGIINPSTYQVDGMKVNQLDRSGTVLRQYNFYGVFPTNVSQIDLSMDTTDSIQEFTVELQVLYWELTANGGAAIS